MSFFIFVRWTWREQTKTKTNGWFKINDSFLSGTGFLLHLKHDCWPFSLWHRHIYVLFVETGKEYSWIKACIPMSFGGSESSTKCPVFKLQAAPEGPGRCWTSLWVLLPGTYDHAHTKPCGFVTSPTPTYTLVAVGIGPVISKLNFDLQSCATSLGEPSKSWLSTSSSSVSEIVYYPWLTRYFTMLYGSVS